MRRLASFSAAALVLTAVLAGCGSKEGADVVLATVGDDAITRSEFMDAYLKIPADKRPGLATAEDRAGFLNDLVNKRLMEKASEAMFPELLDFQVTRMGRYREAQLKSGFEDALIRNQVRVTEADKDAVYAARQKDVNIEALLLPTEDMAVAMMERLGKGVDFADLAEEYSILEYDDPERPGLVGWVSVGTYVWDLEKAVWSGSPGDVVGPFPDKMQAGFYVVRIGESRSVPAEASREEMDQRLDYFLREPFYLARQKAVYDSLQAASNPRFPDRGKALMLIKYYWEPPEELRDDPYAYLNDKRVAPTYTAEEESVLVVEFDNMPDWTAREFTDILSEQPSGIWPRGHSINQLQEVYDILVRNALIEKAALDYGVDKTPEFAEKITSYAEPRDFPGVNIRRLTSLAGQAAIAIENLRLLEETMSRARQLQTAAEIARDASETLAVEELLNRAVNLIASLPPQRRGRRGHEPGAGPKGP